MKAIVLALLTLAVNTRAQKPIHETWALAARQPIELVFDYPELIKVSTWQGSEVQIKGTASINRGEHDDAFELTSEVVNNTLTIQSRVRNKENLPKRVLIKHGANEYYLQASSAHDSEVRKFLDEHGHAYQYMQTGVIIEVELEVLLPKNTTATVLAKYGLVEVKNCDAALNITATYGGADVAVNETSTSEVKARTKFGDIYSNLAASPVENTSGNDFKNWQVVVYKPGTGKPVFVESKYGKVYLRKE